VPKLHSAPPPTGSRGPPSKALFQLYRELRWLEIIWGHWELNAYWSSPFVPHRWHRFEMKRHSLVAGPLTVSVRDSEDEPDLTPHEQPHLVPIDGGKD
jgi:hypothetical protein